MLTLEEFKNMPLTYVVGYTAEHGAHRCYRNSEHKFQKEVLTRRFNGEWKKGEIYFYLDNVKEEFRTIEAAYKAYVKRETLNG